MDTTDLEIASLIESSFMNLLIDSVVFAQMAEEVGKKKFPEASRFSRASILNASLSVECAANCCIARLRNGGRFKDDIDKMPFISKFELYLGLTFNGVSLNRGCDEIEKMKELKAVRDSLVHPKRKTAAAQVIKPNVVKGEWGEWPKLKISRLEKSWNHESAVIVLKATSDFYNYFFLTLCKYNHHQVCSLLMSDFVFKSPSLALPTNYKLSDTNLHKAIENWKLNFDFIGIH